ncbi:Acetyltransferase [Granulibacter bethesdensis]|uniref:Acetyltransferase n=1 Tax=Granulibacter bethesdensis TaxID=364410 RepID=A0AAC9KE57_9PROT|nr:GNAT family N-acetyltransferase [Granulibacter bethesdensis]APH54435.1 Acetyltransferase [Granulibacter bethesdensis]APH62021.1 Acetyltransferase [Granulibacter bethesdensis]
MSDIKYGQEQGLSPDEFIAVLTASGLAERRPIADRGRIERMLKNANLIVTARDGKGRLVGVSRALTDFSYCCYLSDLAVDKALQGRGIGKILVSETRRLAGPEAMCLLLSAPDSMPFYRSIGMPQPDNAFLFKRER